MTRSPPQSTDQPQPTNQPQSTDQFQILYQDVQLTDKKHIEFLKPPSTQPTKPKKICLEEYQDQKQDQAALMASTTEPQEENWYQELALPAPSIDWDTW